MRADLRVARRRIVGWRASSDGATWHEAAVCLELTNAPEKPGGLVTALLVIPADLAPAEAGPEARYLLTIERIDK